MSRDCRLARYVLMCLAGLALNGPSADGQPTLDFSGYMVDLPIYQRQNATLSALVNVNQNQFLNLTRVRLRPTLHLWEGGRIALEHEVNVLYQSDAGGLIQTPAISRRQLINMRWEPVSKRNILIRHFVDRLYFRQNFEQASLIIGRQRISWGTGRIWNPTDLFNPINPASFDKTEKDGADAATFKYYFGSFTDLEIVYNPEDHFKNWNGGARFRTNFGEYDISTLIGYFDKRVVAGADLAGNLFDAGVRGEGIVSAAKSSLEDHFVRFILGLDYQFTSTLYGLIEYQYNGEGATRKLRYDLIRLLRGEILNLGRHYLFVNASLQVHPLVVAAGGVNLNLNDGSGFVSPVVSYSALENLSLHVGGLIAFGSEFTEYWYYPSAVYVKGEWYF